MIIDIGEANDQQNKINKEYMSIHDCRMNNQIITNSTIFCLFHSGFLRPLNLGETPSISLT